MKIKIIVHEAQEGGYWATVPAIPGCVSQGESLEDLLKDITEAIEAALPVDDTALEIRGQDRIFDLTV